MEEESGNLDDFFAKKDRKLRKKTTITPDEIEEKLEKKLKKGKSSSGKSSRKDAGSQGFVLNIKLDDDDEWNEVVEETKDYSGLRVQNLQISEKEQEERDRKQDAGQLDDSGEETGEGGKREAVQGPWKQTQNKVPVGPPVLPEPAVVREAEPEAKDATAAAAKPAGPAKYVPPGARAGAPRATGTPLSSGGAVVTGTGGPRRKKNAPNVDSQDDFPTLGGAAAEQSSEASGGWDYEKVKGGGRSMEDPAKQMAKLSLENKFGALRGESS